MALRGRPGFGVRPSAMPACCCVDLFTWLYSYSILFTVPLSCIHWQEEMKENLDSVRESWSMKLDSAVRWEAGTDGTQLMLAPAKPLGK